MKEERCKRIKEIRQDLRLSQGEFSESLGITQSAISAVEGEKNSPSLEIMENISDKYNVSLYWLLKGIGEKFKRDEELVLVASSKDTNNYEKLYEQQQERIAYLEALNEKLLAKSSVNDSIIEAEVDGEKPLTYSLTCTSDMA